MLYLIVVVRSIGKILGQEGCGGESILAIVAMPQQENLPLYSITTTHRVFTAIVQVGHGKVVVTDNTLQRTYFLTYTPKGDVVLE